MDARDGDRLAGAWVERRLFVNTWTCSVSWACSQRNSSLLYAQI
jgi:hypothetical protein